MMSQRRSRAGWLLARHAPVVPAMIKSAGQFSPAARKPSPGGLYV